MELKNFFAQDDAGNILSAATCYLYVRGTENLVEVLQGANGLALSNPFVSDQQGLVQFAAPNGLYDLRVVKGPRDYRLRMQCNDVTETTAAAENAARALRQDIDDPTDPTKGAAILGRAFAVVASVKALLAAVKRTDQLVEVVAYHDGWAVEVPYVGPRGGGMFRWVPALSATLHNGGSIIDPTRPFPATWTTMAQRTAWFVPAPSGTGVWCRVSKGRSDVTEFGARGYGDSDALSFQKCLLAVHVAGGGQVFIPNPPVKWMLDSPVYLLDRTELFGSGAGCKIEFLNPTGSHGRGGFVMGSSLEANRAMALAAYTAGTFPGASTVDSTYVNLAYRTYLRDHPEKVESRDSSIHDIYITASWTLPTGWGGYGVNFVNAWNCHAHNIWGEGWTQIIGMGSDVSPETPSNHLCEAWNIYCMKPDPLRCYYSIGFISNSTDCHLYRGRQDSPCTELGVGAKEGNMAAMNGCEDCSITDMKTPDLGKMSYASSTGVYMADCQGCFIDDIDIGNARRAVQNFFFRPEAITATKPNIIGRNIIGRNCDVVISIGAKYTHVLGFKNINSTYDIEFYNSNVSGCEIQQKPEKISYGAGWTDYQYLDNNNVKGWMPTDIYLRPADMLVNDKADTQSWNVNKSVSAKAGVALSFLWTVPSDVTAIRGFTLYTTYAGDSLAAGMNITASIRRMAGYNGNSGEAAVIHQTINSPSAWSATTDRPLTSSTSLVVNADVAAGLPNSLDYLIQLTAPTPGSAIKETRMRVYK